MSTTAPPSAAPPQRPTPSPPTPSRRDPVWLILLLLGALVALAAGPLLAVGGVAAVASATQSRDGSVDTAFAPFATDSYALTSSPTSFDGANAALEQVQLILRARADTGTAVFVGIGPTADVAQYLRDVPHSVVDAIGTVPTFGVRYSTVGGSTAPEAPGAQYFWVVADTSMQTAQLRTSLTSGDWTIVVMNADATAPVAVELSAGVASELFAPAAAALLSAGLVGMLLALAAIVLAAFVAGRALPINLVNRPDAVSPVTVVGRLDPRLSRGLWLVKWFLAIPHLIVLALLWVALAVTSVIAWFAILFTGRYPRPLFAFAVGVLRWSWRVTFYAFAPIGTDRYPPFTLATTDYPADLDVIYPQRLSRGLIFVKSWLLALPHLIIVGIFSTAVSVAGADTDGGSGVQFSLLGILSLIAGVILLFRGRYPQPVFDLLMGLQRWCYRVASYVLLLRDDYPPFRLDQGSSDPSLRDG